MINCRADAQRSNPTRAILNFFSLKIEETYTLMNRNFKRQKFHVRKVNCLVRATERKILVNNLRRVVLLQEKSYKLYLMLIWTRLLIFAAQQLKMVPSLTLIQAHIQLKLLI